MASASIRDEEPFRGRSRSPRPRWATLRVPSSVVVQVTTGRRSRLAGGRVAIDLDEDETETTGRDSAKRTQEGGWVCDGGDGSCLVCGGRAPRGTVVADRPEPATMHPGRQARSSLDLSRMDPEQLRRVSRRMSRIFRHPRRPQDLQMDAQGFVPVHIVTRLVGLNNDGVRSIASTDRDRQQLPRFEIVWLGGVEHIKATRGHSIAVYA